MPARKRHLGALVFLVLILGLPTACGGDDDTAAQPATTGEVTGKETESGTGGNPEAGAAVFASAGCGGCHTLEAAGSAGTTGPNLDEAAPSYDRALGRVTNGAPGMPSFSGQLSEQEISDVAAFVAESVGS